MLEAFSTRSPFGSLGFFDVGGKLQAIAVGRDGTVYVTAENAAAVHRP